MLKYLKVENLAIVEHAEAHFGAGLTVLTGETGAGKSVFMGALMLVLGARADASHVRDGAKEARISAAFDASDAADFIVEQGLPSGDDGMLSVRRVISASGGSRVWINDEPVTVQTLKALGDKLVDVHGPNDHQSLLDEAFQRNLIDRFGGISMVDYARRWSCHASLKAEYDRLNGADFSEEERERLQYCVDEISAAKLSEEDDDELIERHAAAAHSAELLELSATATDSLSGEEASAASAMSNAIASFRAMARHHAGAEEWVANAEQIAAEVQELSRAVASYTSRIDADSASMQELDDRLSLVQRLKRRYSKNSAAELIALCEARKAKLAELEGREEKLAELSRKIEESERELLKAGGILTEARNRAAIKFAKAVVSELKGLGFLQAGFSVSIAPRKPDSTGCDAIAFVFEPNPGEPPRTLAQIASTGEIARVMLAVKAVAAGHDSVPVLVFDEIDSNIGGEIGKAVGAKLRAVAEHHQVIAITHLPQSAAFGDRHFVVAKSVTGGRTISAIREVTGEARIAELARMLGGSMGTAAEKHARELCCRVA